MKWKKFLTAMIGALMLFSVAGCGGETNPTPSAQGVFDKDLSVDFKTTLSDGLDYSYARIVECEDGTLVSTAEELNNNFGGIPIYRSTDSGKSFEKNAQNVQDPHKEPRYNAQWQPSLYVLPRDVGDGSALKKGDVLLVATSINNTGVGSMTLTVINLYKSSDKGETWSFLSEVSRSTVNTKPEENGIWEGNIIVNDDGVLIVFFADETDHIEHSQRIVYRSTTDGEMWSNLVEVCALDNAALRPGMPSCTRIKDGEFFIVYEMIGENNVPIYFKKSKDGLNWGDASDIGTRITATETVKDALTGKDRTTTVSPLASPYAAWTSVGVNAHGTIFVTATRTSYVGATPTEVSLIDFFVSYDSGDTWSRVNHPIPYYSDANRPAYSNSLTVSRDQSKLLVANTVQSKAGSNANYLTLAVVDIKQSLKK